MINFLNIFPPEISLIARKPDSRCSGIDERFEEQEPSACL